MASDSLSIREARRIAVRAQGLSGPRPRRASDWFGAVGAVQLDTISVLARSHFLVAWSRLGPHPREAIEAALWDPRGPATFEYWCHAACVLPIERWPHFAARRRKRLARGRRWHRLEDAEASLAEVRNKLAFEGPLTANGLGGAKRGGVWWDWSEVKIAVEWLLDIGEVVCVERRGYQRVYDLAERAVPRDLLDTELDDLACHRALVLEASRALGIATVSDLANHQGMLNAEVKSVIDDCDLVEVTVGDDRRPWYATKAALADLERRSEPRRTLLSPFDSLLWSRDRTQRLFDFVHRLEAYVPSNKRVHGYYSMPVLAGDRLVGLVDPGREADTFVAKHVSVQDRADLAHVAAALLEAARWIDAGVVRIDRVTPKELTDPLRSEVADASAATSRRPSRS